MTSTGQAAVAARVPGAAALGLLSPPTATVLPATLLTDPDWISSQLAARAERLGGGDPRVHSTVWWYSVSAVLLTPSLAGLVTGSPLSARLPDTSVSWLAEGLPVTAMSSAPGCDLAGELRTTLAEVIAAVAGAGRVRERPLWAVATDSLANRLLALGRAMGDVAAATAPAAPLAAAIGSPLPAPRFVDVSARDLDGRAVGRSARFVRRASCCLLFCLPHEPMCTSCPRRPPAERQILLEDAAARR